MVLLLILMHICGFFVALGSYRTSHLGGKPWHQRIPIIGARRVRVHEWPAFWLRFNKSMSLTILSHCPTFKNASWSALGAKLWQQPTIFSLRCRHSVCLYWFAQFLNVTLWNLGWSATLSRSAKKIAKCVSSYMWRSNWLQLAHKIPKCVASLRQKVLRTL